MVALVLTGAGAAAILAQDPSDAVDPVAAMDAVGTPAPSPTEPATSPSAAEDPTARATARAGALSGPPVVDATPQLTVDRERLDPSLETLRGRIDALVAELAPSLSGADVSVAVRDQEGRLVYDREPGVRLLPASTMKSVTAASVLSTLGAEHRFTTTVAATGSVEDGVVRGDLVLRGGGDPVLTTDDYRTAVYPSRPSTSMEDLADAVAAEGIRTVTGRLVGDGTGWGNADLAAGWRTAYLDDQNARRITRLTVNAGLTVKVDIPPDAPVQVELHAATDPVRTAADRFAALLAERGISVRGGTTTARLPVVADTPVAAVQSPTVAELLTFTLQRSDNHLADTLLLNAAHAATGDGSWAAADRTAEAVLSGLGVPAAGLRVSDGSGLSRLDRVTAGQLADLDVAMMAGPHAAPWEAALAVAGQTGTLKNRLRGTAADGRFVGKTGTLDDVKAVVGHVRPSAETGGTRLHLAVMANGVPSGGQWAVTVLMDRLALLLADHQDGCATTFDDQGVPTRTCGGG